MKDQCASFVFGALCCVAPLSAAIAARPTGASEPGFSRSPNSPSSIEGRAPRFSAQEPMQHLDLARFDRLRPNTRSVVCDEGSVVTHEPELILPLRVTLVRFDRETYRRADNMTYDVRLENVGRESVLVPWSARTDAPCDTRERLWVQIGVWMADDLDRFVFVSGRKLVGILSEPATMITLRPGEQATITVPGRWLGSNELAERIGGSRIPTIVQFRAHVFAGQQGGRMFATLVSDNSVAVTFEQH